MLGKEREKMEMARVANRPSLCLHGMACYSHKAK